MGLVDLLTSLGEDRLRYQFLDQAIISMTMSKKSVTKVTFVTDATEPGELYHEPRKTKLMGFVVWIPREEAEQIMKKVLP